MPPGKTTASASFTSNSSISISAVTSILCEEVTILPVTPTVLTSILARLSISTTASASIVSKPFAKNK